MVFSSGCPAGVDKEANSDIKITRCNLLQDYGLNYNFRQHRSLSCVERLRQNLNRGGISLRRLATEYHTHCALTFFQGQARNPALSTLARIFDMVSCISRKSIADSHYSRWWSEQRPYAETPLGAITFTWKKPIDILNAWDNMWSTWSTLSPHILLQNCEHIKPSYTNQLFEKKVKKMVKNVSWWITFYFISLLSGWLCSGYTRSLYHNVLLNVEINAEYMKKNKQFYHNDNKQGLE